MRTFISLHTRDREREEVREREREIKEIREIREKEREIRESRYHHEWLLCFFVHLLEIDIGDHEAHVALYLDQVACLPLVRAAEHLDVISIVKVLLQLIGVEVQRIVQVVVEW